MKLRAVGEVEGVEGGTDNVSGVTESDAFDGMLCRHLQILILS